MKLARNITIAATVLLVTAGCSGGTDAAQSPESESAATQSAEATSPDASRAAPTVAPTTLAPEEDPDADLAGEEQALPWGDGETLVIDMNGTTFASGSLWYGASMDGGTYLMTIGAEGPEDLEAYREKAGADPVGYITVDVDNRQGTALINMYEVAVFDASGQKYVYQTPDSSGQINQWQDALGGIDSTSTYNEGVDLSNKYMHGVDPHERSTMTLVGPALPAEFSVVSVQPSGAGNAADAVPVTKK